MRARHFALAALAACAALALGAPGCGNKFSLPTETPGGVIPEKGSYADFPLAAKTRSAATISAAEPVNLGGVSNSA